MPPVQNTDLQEVRVAFWNAERCKYLAPSLDLLRGVDADINLLCEMDNGMARSGQLHTTRDLAEGLDQNYTFATEFVELDLGDARERALHEGEENRLGLHGAGIISKLTINDPALIRLESDGAWFDGKHGERRIGGRIALAGRMSLGDTELTVICVHFESHGNPQDRLGQMEILLDAIDRYSDGGPVILGGDFNTNSTSQASLQAKGAKAEMAKIEPDRFVDPVPYEPLFGLADRAGYDWHGCNEPGVTQRMRPDGSPRQPFGRLDWFFTRGLSAHNPATIPAIDNDGSAISDHDLLSVTVSGQRSD